MLEQSDNSVSPTNITNNPYSARFARAPHSNPFRASLRSLITVGCLREQGNTLSTRACAARVISRLTFLTVTPC